MRDKDTQLIFESYITESGTGSVTRDDPRYDQLVAYYIQSDGASKEEAQRMARETLKRMNAKKVPVVAEGSGSDQVYSSILSRLDILNKLLPQDASVEWKIENGSYSGINPHDAAGKKPNTPGPEHRTLDTFISFLKKVWTDGEYAASVGLSNADWTGEGISSGDVFWTANNTHYQHVFGMSVFKNAYQLQPEHEKPYKVFQIAKRKTDDYVKALLNGRDVEEPTPEDFVNQKSWHIVISPRSEETTAAAGATAHDVYPKLYNSDGSRKDNPGGTYVGD